MKRLKGCFTRRSIIPRKGKEQYQTSKNLLIFGQGIWEDETSTPYRRWMRTVAEKIRAKVISVEELTVTEEKLYKIIRKRKNAFGIDWIQNFWWKKFQGVWKSTCKKFQ